MTDPGWPHRTADYYPWENRMSEPLSQQVETVEKPEPVMAAELVRLLLLAAVGAGWIAIPDALLPTVIMVGASILVGIFSLGLSLLARGKVWALRKGVDLNSLLDAMRRV